MSCARILSDPESHLRNNVFNASLDIIINLLLQRFVALRETTELFQAVQPSELDSSTDGSLYEHVQRLSVHYNRDISPRFQSAGLFYYCNSAYQVMVKLMCCMM